MKGIIETIRKLGMVRVAMLVAVTIGVLGAFAVLEFQGATPSRMTVLAADLDPQSTRAITDELDRKKIPYRRDDATGQILVPDSDVDTIRATLSKSGINLSSTTGYEIFDRGGDMTLTDFDQQIKLTRALEGELARTIMSVRGITHARVHIVLPHRQPFEHERTEAQASVMLTLAGHGSLSAEAVQSVVNLVAAGVPSLKPQNVTVVDSNLHLLVQAGDADDSRTRGDRDEQIRQKTETRLSQAVEMMLERSLGVGHVHAEASIRMNFDKVNETQEKFDPDSPVVRSTQNVSSNNKTTEKAGPVSLQNNLPNADASNSATGSTEAKTEETTNYEITKTVRAIVHDQPQVERITLAVMVDGVDEVGADGKHTWKPRDQADLDQIQKLVQSAIGFDEKRGDRLDVVSMPFTSTIEVPDTPSSTAASAAIKNPELISFVQIIAFGVIGLAIMVLTARSIYVNLNKPAAPIAIAGAMEGDPDVMLTVGGGHGGGQTMGVGAIGGALGGRAGGAIAGPGRPSEQGQALLTDDSMVSVGNLQVKASSIRKVTQLVESYPNETLAIIRAWIAADQNQS